MRQDAEGFRAFAQARLPALHRSALYLAGDPHRAEDLVQEALVRVYLVWGKRSIADPVAYTHATLTRVFLSSRRRRSSTEYPVDTVPERGYDDSDVAVRLDLQRAIADLCDLDRAIVVMRYLEDRSVEDVAAAVNKSPGNVRVRSSRALDKLRCVLDRHPDVSSTGGSYNRG